MDTRHLRSFIHTITFGSITRAAEELNISQPALGLHIKHLEDELQVLLLVRGSRGVEPTPAGSLLFERAKELIESLDSLSFSIRKHHGPISGSIKLGISHNIAPALITHVLRAATAEYPMLRLHLFDAPGATMQEWVRSGRLDMAILYYPSEPMAGLAMESLGDEKLVFVQKRRADSAPLKPATFAEIFSGPLILPSGPHGKRMLMEQKARELRHELNVSYEVGYPALVLDLVEEGMGNAVMISSLISRDRRPHLAIRPIAPPGLSFSRALFYRETPRLSNAAIAVKSLIKRRALLERQSEFPCEAAMVDLM